MFHYLLPLIIAFPKGYDVCIIVPINQIKERLIKNFNKEKILIKSNLINDGKIVLQKEKKIILDKNNNEKSVATFTFESIKNLKNPSYIEFEIISFEKKLIFSDCMGISFYSIFSNKNKKTFLSDNAFKTGSPNVIYQISKIKRFVDTYSAIDINFEKFLGETMFFINPYKKKISCKIKDEDENIVGIIIPPESVREFKLEYFANKKKLKYWKGHIQIYATNRLISFNYKHDIRNSELISDFEHLDPYRLEDTTYSLSELARIKIGNFIRKFKE